MTKIKKVLLTLIIFTTIIMSIGYASINSISLDINSDISIKSQDGIFISEANYLSSVSTNKEESIILSYSKTTLNSKITLSNETNNSNITYTIKIYNKTNKEYKYDSAIYDSAFYDNENIIFTIEGINKDDIILPNESKEFNITFSYKNNDISNNTLTSYINFKFNEVKKEASSVIVDNVINNGTTPEDVNLDNMTTSEKTNKFSNISSNAEIYKMIDINGKNTSVFRGNHNDNYVSFGGYIWRILQISEDGNIRMILNSGIGSTSVYNSSSSATSLDIAKTKLSYNESTIKTVVDNWYNNNLSNYSDKIVTSKFCSDLTSYTRTSSSTSSSVTYFQSYENIGPDSANYTPSLSCNSEYIFESNIGLISAEEVVLAGGSFSKSNTNYFLYNKDITTYFWTLSPAFYDPNQSYVDVFIVNSDGELTDWSKNLLNNDYEVRPVITIDGNYEMTGNGTETSPYQYK